MQAAHILLECILVYCERLGKFKGQVRVFQKCNIPEAAAFYFSFFGGEGSQYGLPQRPVSSWSRTRVTKRGNWIRVGGEDKDVLGLGLKTCGGKKLIENSNCNINKVTELNQRYNKQTDTALGVKSNDSSSRSSV